MRVESISTPKQKLRISVAFLSSASTLQHVLGGLFCCGRRKEKHQEIQPTYPFRIARPVFLGRRGAIRTDRGYAIKQQQRVQFIKTTDTKGNWGGRYSSSDAKTLRAIHWWWNNRGEPELFTRGWGFCTRLVFRSGQTWMGFRRHRIRWSDGLWSRRPELQKPWLQKQRRERQRERIAWL